MLLTHQKRWHMLERAYGEEYGKSSDLYSPGIIILCEAISPENVKKNDTLKISS